MRSGRTASRCCRARTARSRSIVTATSWIRSCMLAAPAVPGGRCRWAFRPGGYLARWRDADVTKAVHDALHGKLQEGRDAEPNTGVIDSQSEERTPSGGTAGVQHQQEDQRVEAVRCPRH